MSRRSRHSRRHVPDEALCVRVCPRGPHGSANHSQPLRGEDLVEGRGDLLVAVMEEEADWPASIRAADQVACLLGHPGPVGVPGLPKCWAMAHMAMNSRVEPDVICGRLSETASRMGRLGS